MGRNNSHVTSAGIFMAAGLASGVFNYLFQVIAARNLPADTFADFNGWLANLSLLFALGALFQYVGNFWPVPQKAIRIGVILFTLFSLGSLAHWMSDPSSLSLSKAAILVVGSAAWGWFMGQIQIRLAFTVLALAGILTAIAKVGIALFPFGAPDALDRYVLALFAAYIPAFAAVTYYLWRVTEVPKQTTTPSWLAPVVLSISGAALPQFDLILLSHTLSDAQFSEFVRATIFSRALYFLIFIVAQLLLPRQIRGDAPKILEIFPKALAGATGVSLAVTLAAPILSTYVLGWEASPDAIIIFSSCMHMALIALIFLQIQESCAKGATKLGLGILILLTLEGAIQFLTKMESSTYLYFVIAMQFSILLGMKFSARLKRLS